MMKLIDIHHQYNRHALGLMRVDGPLGAMIAQAELHSFVLRNFGALLTQALGLEDRLRAADKIADGLLLEIEDLKAQNLALQGGFGHVSQAIDGEPALSASGDLQLVSCSGVVTDPGRPTVGEAAGDHGDGAD